MAIIRLKEIQGMSAEDRAKRLIDLRAEHARIKTMVKAGGAVENPTRVREIRKTIAQILTVENEIKLGIRKGSLAEEKPKQKAEKTENPEKAEKKPKAKKETAETED
jgi:large subunit ribosomal protein L29